MCRTIVSFTGVYPVRAWIGFVSFAMFLAATQQITGLYAGEHVLVPTQTDVRTSTNQETPRVKRRVSIGEGISYFVERWQSHFTNAHPPMPSVGVLWWVHRGFGSGSWVLLGLLRLLRVTRRQQHTQGIASDDRNHGTPKSKVIPTSHLYV